MECIQGPASSENTGIVLTQNPETGVYYHIAGVPRSVVTAAETRYTQLLSNNGTEGDEAVLRLKELYIPFTVFARYKEAVASCQIAVSDAVLFMQGLTGEATGDLFSSIAMYRMQKENTLNRPLTDIEKVVETLRATLEYYRYQPPGCIISFSINTSAFCCYIPLSFPTTRRLINILESGSANSMAELAPNQIQQIFELLRD